MEDTSNRPGGMSLNEALADPSLAAAAPRVLAGWNTITNDVRWVHTSEVLDIADLLSGGELILVAGVLLGHCTPDQMRDYVGSLHAVGAVGLAIESARIGQVPSAMVEIAAALDFPLIELREVVRFVDVSRAINSRLVATSVRELQFNDDVTHTLAGVLAAHGDEHAMVTALRDVTGCGVSIRSLAGDELAAAVAPHARPTSYARTVPIESGGITIATLEIMPCAGVDLQLVDAACRRAPEPIALALLSSRPLTRSDQYVRHIFRALNPSESPDTHGDLTAALNGLGLQGPATYVGVVAISAHGPLHTRELTEVLGAGGSTVISEVRDGQHRSVVRIPHRGNGSLSSTDELQERLMSTAMPSTLRVGLTQPATSLASLRHSMETASAAAYAATGRDYVGLARDVLMSELLQHLDSNALNRFLDQVLGPLLRDDRCDELLLTLVTLHRTGSRSAAAIQLNLHRQTMYQRLQRISRVLGGMPDEISGARGAFMVAVELAWASR